MQVLQRPCWNGSPIDLGELFVLTKEGRQLRCVIRTHQFGWELWLRVDSHLDAIQSRVCRTQEEVLATGEQWKAALADKGWLRNRHGG